MKLFAFQPSSYGQQWFVVSENRDAAITAVRKWIAAQPTDWDREFYTERLDPIVNGEDGAHIAEHGIDEPVRAEIC